MKLNKKKIWRIISYVLLIPLLLLVLLFVGAALPGIGNYQVLTVLSGSMEPAIRVGSTVVVNPAEDYKIGDVITFRAGGRSGIPTTHRIEDIRTEAGEPVYITKGDANPAADIVEVRKENVVGKVLFSIPYLGYAVNFAQKPIGFASMIIVPAVLIISGELKNIYKEVKKIKA